MSTPEQAGPGRTARLAGLALLALAAVALVVGLISVIGGDEPEQGANPPPSSGTSSAEQPGPPPSSGSEQPPGSQAPSGPPGTPPGSPAPPPATSAAPPPQPPPPAGPDRSQPVRVYNNSNIKGLADSAANDLRGVGWNVAAVDNYPGGRIAVTTIYYRPGTPEESAARELAKEFGNLRVEPRFEGIQDAAPGIIMIVTREYKVRTK